MSRRISPSGRCDPCYGCRDTLLDKREEDIDRREWKLRHSEPMEIELRDLECWHNSLRGLQEDMIQNEKTFLEWKKGKDAEVEDELEKKNAGQERICQKRADLDKE